MQKNEGLECPKCGCRHFYTRHTRRSGKRILRERECRHCGRKIRTMEEIY